MSLCTLENVTKTYGSGPAQVHAVHDISLSFSPGEFAVLSGPSGSGKTTLLNQIGCLDLPSEGQVRLDGIDVSTLGSRALSKVRADKIGFIFQSFNLIPVLSAVENIELALQLAGRPSGARAAALEILPKVGLEGLGDRRPNQLSGGQQQRVAIARALVKRPLLVIADEPTANLDSHNGEQVLDIMRELNQQLGTTFIFSSHDPMVIERAQRVVSLHDGAISDDRWIDAPAPAEAS